MSGACAIRSEATPMASPLTAPAVLFDGVCNLCNAWVRFVIRRDPAGIFRFAAQQSPAGRAIIGEHLSGSPQLSTCYSDCRRLGLRRIYCRVGDMRAAWAKLVVVSSGAGHSALTARYLLRLRRPASVPMVWENRYMPGAISGCKVEIHHITRENPASTLSLM